MNTTSTKLTLSRYLYNIQQRNKKLKDPAYSIVLKQLQSNPNLVPNRNAKKFLNPTLETTRREKRNLQTFGMSGTKNLNKLLKAKRLDRKRGKLSEIDHKLLEKLYTQGPAAYGNIQSLMKASKLPENKVVFLVGTDAHAEYCNPKKFPPLEVQTYRINEIWSIDIAYMDKIAKFYNAVKYLLVAVNVLSRFLRVEPLIMKTAIDTTLAFKRLTTKIFPEKVWPDKGTEFKADFKQFDVSKSFDLYNKHMQTKSAFAERNIRSLKNII